MKPKIKLPRKPPLNLPHPVESENTQVTVTGAPPVMNEANLELGKRYLEDNEALLLRNIVSVRDFVLTDIAPILLGLENGFREANEVLGAAFEEDPELGLVGARLRTLANQAVVLKLAEFVGTRFRLGHDSVRLLKAINLAPSESKPTDLLALLEDRLKRQENQARKKERPVRHEEPPQRTPQP